MNTCRKFVQVTTDYIGSTGRTEISVWKYHIGNVELEFRKKKKKKKKRRRERERRRERKKRVTMAPRRQVTVEFDAACGSFRSDEREEVRLRTRRRSVVVDLNEISGEGREEGRSGYSRCQVTLRQVLSHVEATTTTKVRENVEWISITKKTTSFRKS